MGTLAGATITGLLPAMVRSALGIAIYGMFLAIIIPPAKTVRPVAVTVVLAGGVEPALRGVAGDFPAVRGMADDLLRPGGLPVCRPAVSRSPAGEEEVEV